MNRDDETNPTTDTTTTDSTMKPTTDIEMTDPRWTAYVLGELDGDDLAAIEAALASSEDARAHVAALREVTRLLTSELASEPAPVLSGDQRRAIETAAGDGANGAAGADDANVTQPGDRPAVRDSNTDDLAAVRVRKSRRGLLFGGVIAGGIAAAAAVMFAVQPMEKRAERTETIAESRLARVHSMAQQEGPPTNRNRRSASKQSANIEAARNAGYLGVLNEAQLQGNTGLVLDEGSMGKEGKFAYGARHSGGEVAANARFARGVKGVKDDQLDGHGRYRGGDDNRNSDDDGETAVAKVELPNRENYAHVVDNPFVNVADDPLSTFSTDVDTASYANIRRMLRQGALPPPSAVRIEEMVNYFDYDYAQPTGDHPFAVHLEVSRAPWQPEHKLLRVALKGRELTQQRRPRSNLVFLLDVSGSMQPENKLPLLVQAFARLVGNLDVEDRIAIVVYAGASGVVLPSTPVSRKREILAALDRLGAGGSTNGGAGIELAYSLAQEHFVKNGVNRVILATDGDFNVGTTSQGELVELIEEKAKSGVFLTVLGFGMGNYQDATLEQIADHGNGNYFYIDSLNEANKVLGEDLNATLVAIAKDVKIQIEFNPAKVSRYRLIGYENRVMAHQDFNDDRKDAGDVGAGHTVTALYELVPAGAAAPRTAVDALKYQRERVNTTLAEANEMATIKLRYKRPDGDTSKLLSVVVRPQASQIADASPDLKLAAGVALFGMVLRGSEHRGSGGLPLALDLLGQAERPSASYDRWGYRAELVELIRTAQRLGAEQRAAQ